MGSHKGWRIRKDANGSHRAEVWLPAEKRYKSKSFAAAGEAKTWALTEVGRVFSGMPEIAPKDLRVTVESIKTPYLKNMLARGRADRHISNVKRTLQSLQDRVPDLADPSAGAEIEEWLEDHTASPGTRNRMLAEMRAMMGWAIKRDLLAKDPTRAIGRFARMQFIKPQFTIEELRTLFFHEHDYRRRFIVMTYLGLRKDEAAAITEANLEGGVALIRMHTGHDLKGKKERIVPLQDEMLLLVPLSGNPSGQLAPVKDSSGSRSFRDFLEDAGVPVAGRSPHSCRHTYASMMIATGIPDLLLKGYMGHESTQTTAVYTKMATRYVQAVESWGRGKLRICEGMTSPLKKKPPTPVEGSHAA